MAKDTNGKPKPTKAERDAGLKEIRAAMAAWQAAESAVAKAESEAKAARASAAATIYGRFEALMGEGSGSQQFTYEGGTFQAIKRTDKKEGEPDKVSFLMKTIGSSETVAL